MYPAHLPKIANLFPSEMLLLYLALLEEAVSMVLVVKRAKEQISVYYVRPALAGAEANDPIIKMFAYTLVMASWRLRPNFEAHKVVVLTDQPLKMLCKGWTPLERS